MDRLRKVFETIRSSLGGLDASQKLLIGSLLVVLLMTLFVVQQYAGKGAMTPLLGASYAAEDQQAAASWLQANNIEHEVGKDGLVGVPVERRSLILAQMSQDPKALPSDTTLLFEDIVEKQSWTKSSAQNDQLEVIALQNELSYMLSQWRGIKNAKVILDVPKRQPLGQPARAATASVNVFSESGLDQQTVDAIAGFVAGSRAGLIPARVRIVDGTTNRQHRVLEEGAMTAATALELVAKIEGRKREQISDMLRYIPGVIVTVHAQVDARKREATITKFDKEGEGTVSVLASEEAKSLETTEPVVGAEAGVRANTGADITTGTPLAGGTSESVTDTTMESRFGETREHILDPRGHATKINAVVNVPRPYFVQMWRDREGRKGEEGEGGGEAGREPTDADLDEIARAELDRIRGEVEQMIDTSAGGDGTGTDATMAGEVKVSMIPVAPDAMAGFEPAKAGLFGFGGGGAGSGGMAMEEMVKTVGLGGLAVLALGLVVFTAVKANKREALPTAEELVGIPPALDAEDHIVGEAEAAELALAGIELTDDAMKDRQVLEQVQGMILENPEDSARLVTRWIREHE